MESDEEDHVSKAKMKRKKNWDDTPWSPKGTWIKLSSKADQICCLDSKRSNFFFFSFIARVMPTLPKQDRPAREGARVASVETGLAAAAAKLAQQVSWETEYLVLDASGL